MSNPKLLQRAPGEQHETEGASMVETLARHFRDQASSALDSKNI